MNRVFKALSDPSRRKVLQLLHQRPMTAGELADEFDVSKPTMSAHFAVLREADLAPPESKGRIGQIAYEFGHGQGAFTPRIRII